MTTDPGPVYGEHRGMIVPVSDEMLASADEMRRTFRRWMSATPEERERWADEARAERVRERAAADLVSLTVDALLGKLGFSRAYAEHLVQPYCYCGDSADGWDRCAHARDLGLGPGDEDAYTG